MSSVESQSASATLLQETADRLGDQSPVLGLPRMAAVENLVNVLADQRKRVRDSHRVQMKALGHVAEEGEEVGISVAGDTTINNYQPVGNGSLLRKLAPLLLAAITGGALPIAGFLLARYFGGTTQQPAPIEDRDYEILFYDADGNPIKVPHVSERR